MSGENAASAQVGILLGMVFILLWSEQLKRSMSVGAGIAIAGIGLADAAIGIALLYN